MSYEEIDRDAVVTNLFTNGTEGRYSKPKSALSINDLTEKNRAPKMPTAIADDIPYENGSSDGTVKTKKKIRKIEDNAEIQNEYESATVDLPIDEETVAKPKKKRAPKAESKNENANPIPSTVQDEVVKKKKSKAPKIPAPDEASQLIEGENIDQTITDKTTKVKKTKKKAPKAATEQTDDMSMNNTNEYTTYQDFDDIHATNGNYASDVIDMPYDAPLLKYQIEAEQIPSEPIFSDYEASVRDAFSNLASSVDFLQYVGGDQWFVLHPPKSARNESKSRIRKIIPGMKDDKSDGKSSSSKATNQKGRFFNRLRYGVSALVRDENNLIFGERSNYDVIEYADEEDEVDTDDLHRYAQKLRELEDNDKEVNPEYLVLRDGKTVYAVQETDAEGKMTLATRKPIYDRFSDQAPDSEPAEKKKILSRLKNPFSRNKDKDSKGVNSPKTGNDGLNSSGKRTSKKSSNKNIDDGMATIEPLMD